MLDGSSTPSGSGAGAETPYGLCPSAVCAANLLYQRDIEMVTQTGFEPGLSAPKANLTELPALLRAIADFQLDSK